MMIMTTVIALALKASVALIVFVLGVEVRVRDATYLLCRPSLLLRSLVSINIVMPLVTAALVALFNLHPAVKLTLVVLSVSPVPPLLPKKQLMARGGAPYAFSLLVT